MPITTWPNEDKPREKLISKGENSLTDAELIAVFLNTGIRGKTALDLAKEFLAEFGGLKPLLTAPIPALTSKSGMGLAKVAVLKAAVALGLRYQAASIPSGDVFNHAKTAEAFLTQRLRHYSNEVFACLFLDARYRLIRYEELFHGTVSESTVYPREVIRRGLALNATHLILAHNHPSGNPAPSEADRDITRLIKQAAQLVDMKVADHIIIGNPEVYSFAGEGRD